MDKYKIKISENDVKATIKGYLDLTGWDHWHNMAGLASYPGIPDRTAIRDGIVLFIELKAPGKKQSENQIKFEEKIKRQSGHYIVVHSVEELAEYIENITGIKETLF